MAVEVLKKMKVSPQERPAAERNHINRARRTADMLLLFYGAACASAPFARKEASLRITVSGLAREVRDGLTMTGLITLARVENPEYVTVVVNDVYVDRGDFERFELHEGDRVEFLYFMGGGA